jgi:hypothetical protein
MDQLSAIFFIALALVTGLGLIAVWSRRQLFIRLGAVALTVAFLPLSYVAFSELLSKPKPVSLEWANRNAKEATVLASQMQEDVAIYVWLAYPEAAEPRAYVLPWNRQAAQQLQGANRQAEKTKSKVRMRRPFRVSMDSREELFYAAPQQAGPDKNPAGDGAMVYNRSDESR